LKLFSEWKRFHINAERNPYSMNRRKLRA
jgi:hypothetical protein